MSLKNPRPNANFVPEYQISGVPYVTASAAGEVTSQNVPIRLDFPEVTRWISVYNSSSAGLRVGFTANGARGVNTANYFVVKAGETTPRMELRCKTLYFTKDSATAASFNIIAGLTRIRAAEFPVLTGSTSGSIARAILGGVG
tara:strand:- start:2326 stop:2754 length:429 start_codon:yes stop_codon:yes gene_type:complete